MNLIVCVDNKGGMAFNHRRCSRDLVVQTRILMLAKESRLWMNSYSAKLFEAVNEPTVNVSEQPLDEAGQGEYCFIEDMSAFPYMKWIEKIILFRWNRSYPSDLKFDIPLDDGKWLLTEQTDFEGRSHERITMEVYTRCSE